MVQCGKCGLLAIHNPATGECCQVTEQARAKGWQKFGRDTFIAKVFCSKNARQFDWPEIISSGERVVEKITEEIKCEEYRPWILGKTPQQHEQMDFITQMQLLQQQYREEDRRDRERSRRIDRYIAIAGVIAAILAGVASGLVSGLLLAHH